jgi:hypothetical protein
MGLLSTGSKHELQSPARLELELGDVASNLAVKHLGEAQIVPFDYGANLEIRRNLIFRQLDRDTVFNTNVDIVTGHESFSSTALMVLVGYSLIPLSSLNFGQC